jgi:hypothetical protein
MYEYQCWNNDKLRQKGRNKNASKGKGKGKVPVLN